MKNLIATILLFTSLGAVAQELQQQPPRAMTEQEAVMMEFAQATVMQLMCVVHYERKGEAITEEDEAKIEVFAIAPLAHGAQHGIPAVAVTELVTQTLPQIRAQWTQMTSERQAEIPNMCESAYLNIAPIVEAYKEFLEEQEQEQEDPVMNLNAPTQSI